MIGTDGAVKALMIMLSPICCVMSAKADYSPNFGSGKLPAGVTTSNSSEVKPGVDFYKRGWTEDGWTVDRMGGKGYVVMAPTHTGSEVPVNSLLTLPAQDVTENMVLSWEALSLLPGFPESYRVLVQPEGAGAEEVFAVDGENSGWTRHIVSLERFAGRKCAVSFLCNSVNRYMLMLSGIRIGALKENDVVLTDRTERYGDMSGTTVRGIVRNVGTPIRGGAVVCYLADGSEAGRMNLGDVFDSDRTEEFAIRCPGVMDTATEYTLSVVTSDGTQILTQQGSFYTSSFRRTLLVDKATGMWCVNCPKGALLMEDMEREYGSQVVGVETHIYNNDPLENVPYWDSLGFHSVPYFMLNRVKATSGDDLSKFAGYYDTPTRFGIRFGSITVNGNESVSVSVAVSAAEAFDNSADRYRVGYVLTAGFHSDDYLQANTCNMPADRQFFYLPARIPGELVTFHNVSLTSEYSFDGIGNSLPSEIQAGGEMEFFFTVNRPELLADLRQGRIVAYVLDTESGEVLNVAARGLAEDYSGVRLPSASVADCPGALTVAGNGLIQVRADGKWTLRCYDMAGSLCHQAEGCGDMLTATNFPAGMYVARLETGNYGDIVKFIVK